MKTPDHQELWRDALNDAAPDAYVEATLALTIVRARRARRTRHAIRITAAVVAVLVGAHLFRSTHTMVPNDSAPALTAQSSEPKGIPVRYLTDEELLARFPDQPVALVGSGSSREFLVLANATSD